MFKFSKKQVVIGICGFLIALLLAIIFINLSPRGHILEISPLGAFYRIISILLFCIAVGFLGYIFSGLLGFFTLLIPVSIFALIKIILMYLENLNTNLYFYTILTVILSATLIVSLASYLSTKNKIDTDFKSDNLNLNKIHYDEIYSTDDFKYIIIVSNILIKWYQVIKYEDKLYFHYLKRGINRYKDDQLFKNKEDLEGFLNNKYNFIIDLNKLNNVTLYENRLNDFISNGSIVFNLSDNKKKKYSYIGNYNYSDLDVFFNNKTQAKNIINEEDIKLIKLTPKDKKILHGLNLFKVIYTFIISILLSLLFITNFKIGVFIINLIIMILILLLPFIYILFNKYVMLADKSSRKYKVKNTGKVSFISLFIFPLLVLMMRYLLDINFFIKYDYLKLLLFSLIPLAILLSIFFIFFKEYKKDKNAIISIIIFSISFSLNFIYCLDKNFDLSEGKREALKVIDKEIYENNSNEITYYFYVSYNDEVLKVNVSESTYNESNEITIIVEKGLLDINKVIYYDSSL